MYKSDNIDTILKHFICELNNKGNLVSPRGYETKELLGQCFELTNPRNRIIFNPARKVYMTFGIGELLWIMRGSNELDIIQYYNKKYKNYSDNGQTLYGAYGKRIVNKQFNLWEEVKNKLESDPSTRQAIIPIYSAQDTLMSSKDIPCTCLLQFLIRDNKLNCITYMRSNDIILGLPYDIFNFTMLQELMASQLNLELGTYKHFVGSLHLYSIHYQMSKNILEANFVRKYSMGKMPLTTNDEIKTLLDIEEKIRVNTDLQQCPSMGIKYWDEIIQILFYKKISMNKDIASTMTLPDWFRACTFTGD